MNLSRVRDELRENGFARVSRAFDIGHVRALAGAFDRLEARARAIAAGEQAAPPRSACAFVVDDDPFRLHRVVWAGGADARLAELAVHPTWLQLAATALGTGGPLVQLIQQAHYKLPGDGVSFGWHQDASNRRFGTELWNDLDGEGTYVQMALAIDPMTAENGPLRMLRGSHRLGFVADRANGRIDPLPDLPVVELHLEPGDLVVFGAFTIHGSGPNRSDRARRLFLQGYTLPGVNGRDYPGCGLGVERQVPR